jgi:midasin
MNLASQSILEALNSCFDFRNEIYIAELNRRFRFDRLSNCRFFACQNSAKDGGGRKALPKSFLNRFTKIYVESMSEADMHAIVQQCLIRLNDKNTTDFYIQLHKLSNQLISLSGGASFKGAPYEYNLRDLLRLIDSLKNVSSLYITALIGFSAITRLCVRPGLHSTLAQRRGQNRIETKSVCCRFWT